VLTPWGISDHETKLAEGVFLVDTPSHGGILVEKKVARTYLSCAALQIGSEFGPSHIAYEEDCDMAVVMFEHLDEIYHLMDYSIGVEELREIIEESINEWHPEYFQAIENMRKNVGL